MIFVGNPTGMRSALLFSSRVLSRTSLKLNNASMASSSSSVLTGSAAATDGSSTFDGSLFCTRSGRVSSIWPVGTPVKSVAVTFLALEVDGTTGNVVVDVASSPLFVFFGSGDTVRFCCGHPSGRRCTSRSMGDFSFSFSGLFQTRFHIRR